MPEKHEKRATQPSLRILVYGFAAMIALGTLLLMLPFSSESGGATPFVDALFTATSSVCVTGLVVVDTLDHWSFFGELVILVLIQFGGFGYMTITTLFLIALGRKIGLRERLLVGESIGLSRVREVSKLIRNLFLFAMGAEALGAAIFYIRFSADYEKGAAIWKSVFQSVSAFNNAGFDIFGGFRSITGYHDSLLVVLTTAGLVVIGGLGYLVIQDVFRTRRPDWFSIDTKMVLSVSALLLISGMVIILATEYANPSTLGVMSISDKVLNAFFHSVTPRTAGFNTISVADMNDYALFFTMILMFIGGASGSTAGGIKVGTFGLVFTTMWSAIRGKEHPGAFGREFMTSQIFRALALVMLSIGVVAVVVFLLNITEDFEFLRILFESVSAFGTVGLSTGITPDLSITGRLIIIVTMFIGRLGPLTLTLALVRAQSVSMYRYPREIVRIG
ncbi:MAG: hypothetical protein A2147_05405 [Chloroflexi bacterium RBG_16_57_8]|nr:MAG: hypothetical protein A2147_05405 [Chloroflexi bacterium RBG_16_57_8]